MTITARPATLRIRLRPKSAADQDKLGGGLGALMASDVTIRVRTDPVTGAVVLLCCDEMHLERILDRLSREFGVAALVGRPEVVYREALTHAAEGEAKYARETAGRGQYAHVKIRVYPQPPGSAHVFENAVDNETIPAAFIAAIDGGIRDGADEGLVDGYPIDDLRVVLHGGSYHPTDSTDEAFRIAGMLAFHDAAVTARRVLVEPIMRVEVDAPAEYMDDITANLSSRRAEVQPRSRYSSHATALVPLSEMFGYASDLHSQTFGQSTLALSFEYYRRCARPSEWFGGDSALVMAPAKPKHPRPGSGIALPEPLDDEERDG